MSTEGAGTAQLHIAGLEIAFHSHERVLLELLRNAAATPPGFPSRGARPPALTVTLSGKESLSYRATSMQVAVAGISLDEDSIEGHLSAVCRAALSQALDSRGGALIHGAAVVIDGRAILLIAPSEGGKTTVCGLLDRAGVPVLSDETLALRPRTDGPAFDVHGTFFWSGPVLGTIAGGWPIHAIGFLEKGPLAARRISPAEALARFLPEWHVEGDEPSAAQALNLATQVVESTHGYRFSFGRDDPPPAVRELLRSWVRA